MHHNENAVSVVEKMFTNASSCLLVIDFMDAYQSISVQFIA
jgi:hypothetical protein